MKNNALVAILVIMGFIASSQTLQAAPLPPTHCVASTAVGLLNAQTSQPAVALYVSFLIDDTSGKNMDSRQVRIIPTPNGAPITRAFTNRIIQEFMNADDITNPAHASSTAPFKACSTYTVKLNDLITYSTASNSPMCIAYGYDVLSGRNAAGYSAKPWGSQCGCYFGNNLYNSVGVGRECPEKVQGQTVSCTGGQIYQNGGCTCPSNTYWNTQSQSCQKLICTGGQTDKGGYCACPANQQLFDGTCQIPITCNGGNRDSHNQCICPANYRYNSDTGSCDSIIAPTKVYSVKVTLDCGVYNSSLTCAGNGGVRAYNDYNALIGTWGISSDYNYGPTLLSDLNNSARAATVISNTCTFYKNKIGGPNILNNLIGTDLREVASFDLSIAGTITATYMNNAGQKTSQRWNVNCPVVNYKWR